MKSDDSTQHGVPEYTKLLRAFLRISDKVEDDQVLITRQEAIRYLSEKIKIDVSVYQVLEIGMNAQIDYENTEYIWFEKVFNFYCKIEVLPDPADVHKSDSEISSQDEKSVLSVKEVASPWKEPDLFIGRTEQIGEEGMDQVQFYIFCKDVGIAPYAGNKVESFTLFETTCQNCARKNGRLKANDFIDLIKSINQMRNAKLNMEHMMAKRHFQIYSCEGSYE